VTHRFYELDLSEEFRRELRETLAEMIHPVSASVFLARSGCGACSDTLALMKAIEEEAPVKNGEKLFKLNVYWREEPSHAEAFKRERVERVPTVSFIEGLARWTGIPAGEEIRALVEVIMRISERESGLEDTTKSELKRLKGRVHIEVIVTPSCPYCPYAVLLSHMFAYEAYVQGNPVILSEAVEAYENPDIADKYGVMSVPSIAINGQLVFVGVPYEEDFINYVKAAAEGRLTVRGPIEAGETESL
jgi:glutaredoxin-like protein